MPFVKLKWSLSALSKINFKANFILNLAKVLIKISFGFNKLRLSSTPQASVHIYPGDGTLIKSTGTPDYFTHIIPHGSDGLDERMLSLRSPPPDHPGAAYSIAGVMRKASR